MVDAILDRIVHDFYTIEIHSDKERNHSMREEYGLKKSISKKLKTGSDRGTTGTLL